MFELEASADHCLAFLHKQSGYTILREGGGGGREGGREGGRRREKDRGDGGWVGDSAWEVEREGGR